MELAFFVYHLLSLATKIFLSIITLNIFGLLCLSSVALSNEDISLNNDFKFINFSLNVNMEIYRGGHPCLLTLLRAAILFV